MSIIGVGVGVPFVNARNKLIILDRFNRADSTNLGNAETGQLWAETYNDSEIKGQKLKALTQSARCMAVVDALKSDVSIETICRSGVSGTEGIGVTFRYSDASNHIYCEFSYSGNKIEMVKVNADATTIIGSKSLTINADTDYAFKVTCKGDKIEVFLNGNLEISTTEVFNQDKTKVGSRIYTTNVANSGGIDTFKVEAI